MYMLCMMKRLGVVEKGRGSPPGSRHNIVTRTSSVTYEKGTRICSITIYQYRTTVLGLSGKG